MLKLNVNNEISRLRVVVLGTAQSCGPVPDIKDAYDPKSAMHIAAGTYPLEIDMTAEMDAVAKVFEKYQVEVFRPTVIKDYNQIFSRDIGFVIDNKFIKSNILPDRAQEIDAIQHVLRQIPATHIFKLPEDAHVEGGDVMPHGDYIFVGVYTGKDYPDIITARTNKQAVSYLASLFPKKRVVSFELRKHNTDPRENALHLDCCFQPVGKDKAILHKNGFLVEEEYNWLVNLFGKENIFEIDKEEMFEMNSNIFSISPEVVISDSSFTRLNAWLRTHGITVEEVPYREIAKQEGLLRCSTLPLVRD